MQGASTAMVSFAARRDWNAKSRKIEAAGAAAVAAGAGNYFYLPRLPEIIHAHAGDHADVRAHGLSWIFRLHRGRGGIFRRGGDDPRAFHARGWAAAGG